MKAFLLLAVLLADPEVITAINQMDDDIFLTREKGSKTLERLALEENRGVMQLEIASKIQSLEVRRRSEIILRKYNNILPSFYEQHPWIDCLPKDYPNRDKIIIHYNSRVSDYSGHDGRWPVQRESTKLFINDLVQSGKMKRKDAIKLLNDMALREKDWWEKEAKHEMPESLKKIR